MTHPSVNSIVERLRAHVNDRGGCFKDDDGNVVIPNGAWSMMLEAATIISELQAALYLEKNKSANLEQNYHELETRLQAENGRLTREIQSEKDESDTYCKWWREEQEVTRNIKARLTGAESSLSRIKEETIEECARVAEDERVASVDLTDEVYNLACDHIASAIRSLGSTGGDKGAAG